MGRRASIALTCTIAGVTFSLAGYWHDVFIGGWSVFYLMIMVQQFFGSGSYSIIGPYMAEIWPSRLRASGIGIIYVTHRLDEVFRIADRVTVLRDGRRVATAPVADTSTADLVEKIVGRSMTAAFVEPAPSSDRIVFAVDGVVAQHVGPVSFTVKAGETLYWCACGLSKNQPLCDGSHKDTGFVPLAWTADADKTAYLCTCKQTHNAPLCDGSHKSV